MGVWGFLWEVNGGLGFPMQVSKGVGLPMGG